MTEKENLKQEFAVDLNNRIKEIIDNVYIPKLFIRMVNELGPYEATKKTILKDNTTGYLKIMESKKPWLLIENLVVEAKYKSLFTEEEIKLCNLKLGIPTRDITN